MNLLDILSLDCIKAPLQATDKKGVIYELVDLLAAAGKVKNPGALKDAVWTRETMRTTGIGHSLAIPHGKCDGIPKLAMAIGKPAEPIDFAAIDNKPVRLVILLASPLEKTADHIQALARISKLMTSEEFRNKMYEASTPQQIYTLIHDQEVATAGAGARPGG